VTPAHADKTGAILADLGASAAKLAGTGATAEGAAAMYGMLGSMPDRVAVNEFILQFLDSLDA
jgi:hypothetical protein